MRQFPSVADHVVFVSAGSENGKRYGQQGQGSGRMPGFGQLLTDDADQGHRRLRAGSVMGLTTVLAFGWNPEIRGILFAHHRLVALCGSVYLLLGTNLGARLGFLVAMAGLFGWMILLGSVWWAYGIGLQGRPATWEAKEIVVGDLPATVSEVRGPATPTTHRAS